MIDADVDFESKHLKGRLGPRVRDVTFYAPKGVGWGPVFVTSHFFAPKEVGWSPEVLLQKSNLIHFSVCH